ncbi:MAG: helix-turn-helix domain-containing protein, partial [Candidatus Omnitrophica bacterium]|nr:helix-turn-helix domain-containing protein [Candidatus Omnitrophota bacterium]
MEDVEREYSLKEVSEILGVTHRTVQRWVQNGKVNVVRKSNGYMYISQS